MMKNTCGIEQSIQDCFTNNTNTYGDAAGYVEFAFQAIMSTNEN